MKQFFTTCFLFLIYIVHAQQYPQNYFMFPLEITPSLSANFGELRPNHYHMGLDIRTQQRENLRVLAAADGYVSRIFISHTGYGNMMTIKHTNGMETLYGHLNEFYSALAKYVENKQYQDQSWAQDFRLPPNLFQVKKGQFIALSGNTGGSAGPHVHFEIRDAITGNGLNPMLFGLGITDNMKPEIYGLYYYDRKYSTYQAPAQRISLNGTTGNISASTIRVGTPSISFGYTGEDKTSPSSFKFGIYKTTLIMDGVEQITCTHNNIPFDEQRYINAGIDYKKKTLGGPYIEHLSRLPGNKLNIFSGESDGIIDIGDGKPHRIQIVFQDTKGNTSTVNFTMQYVPALETQPTFPKNLATVYPNRPGRLNTPGAEFIYSPRAFYDYFNFDMQEITGSGVSNTIKLDNAYIPVHDEYSIAIKAKDVSAKDKTLLMLTSGSYKAYDKGIWHNNVLTGHFNRLGNVTLVKDFTRPVINAGNVRDGMVVKNGSLLRLSASDNLGVISNFKVIVNGQWLLFKRRGNTFTYTVNNYLPSGKSTISASVEDLAGNKTTKEFTLFKN